MAKWLDKYEQGGLVLKKKTKDNYGKKPNVNDVKVSAGPGFEGDGYTAQNWKSPAWGGQFAMGGSLPGAVGFMYARTQNPAPANGKYAKKTLASAQNGAGLDPELFNINTQAAQDATRNVIPRKMTAAEKKEASASADAARKRGQEKRDQIIAERTAKRQTKGDLNTPGTWNTAEKLRLFPNDVGGLGEMYDEYINPAMMVGSLTDAVGESVAARSPEGVALSLGMAAGMGALGLDPLGSAIKTVPLIGKGLKAIGSKIDKNALAMMMGKEPARLEGRMPVKPSTRFQEAANIAAERTRIPSEPPTGYGGISQAEIDRYMQNVDIPSAPPSQVIANQERTAAIRQQNTPRTPYEAPTDSELLRMNEAEANRYFRRPAQSQQPAVDPDSFDWTPNSARLRREGLSQDQIDSYINNVTPDSDEFVYFNEGREIGRSADPNARVEDFMDDDELARFRNRLGVPHPQPEDATRIRRTPVPTGPKWGEKEFKIGDARQTATHTDAEGNSFKQYVYDWGDARSGNYRVEDPEGGYMELSTRQDLLNPDNYLQVTNMNFKNDVDASAAKQFSKIMAHLPDKVDMGHISTSMYSQPLMNQQVARWANNNPGRVEVRNVDLKTLNPWHKGMDFPTDPEKGYPKYGNRLDQTIQQFPKLQKTVKSMSKYTGVDLPEPRLEFYDMSLDVPKRRPITLEELNSEGFKRKLQQDPSIGNKVTMKAPTYDLIKHWRNGGHFVDSMGQWAHPGDITTIPSNDITMRGVNYDVMGISNTGDKKLMKPGKNYKFDGDYVTEYPKGGWLEKYK